MSDTPVPDALRNGSVLIPLVAVLAVAAAGATVLAFGGGTDELLWGLGVGIGAAVAILAAYLLGRAYGQPHSHAVAQSAVVFGVIALAGVIARLLRSSDRISDTTIALGLVGAVVATVVIIAAVGAAGKAGPAT
jgi:tellurite resistance protein TehA-like permease